MSSILLAAAAIYCAYRVMRAGRLLNVTIWLAMTSALVSAILFSLGAPEVAVMELSVGAGLVTVLFVYAFAIVGEMTFDDVTSLPRPLIWFLILAISLLLGWFVYPITQAPAPAGEMPFAAMLWQQRGLDVVAQMVLIFSGVMGLLGLLSDTRVDTSRRQQILSEWLDLSGGRRVADNELPQILPAAPATAPTSEETPHEVHA